MATVKFGTICDLCGEGSRDYAHDANFCVDCEKDFCDECARNTHHIISREEDEGKFKEWMH